MLNIDIVLDLANDYSVNAGVFRDSGNFVKEYANLCSATALYLLALQSEQLDRDQRQELITKCESYIKLQEEIEHTRFSVNELIATDSPSKKKRKKKTVETSLKTEDDSTQGFQQQQLLQHASNVDEKDIILAAEETHAYYSESDDSVDFNPNKPMSSKKKGTPKKKAEQAKIKIEPKTPVVGSSSQTVEDIQLVQVSQDPVVVSAPDHFGYCTVTPDVEVTEGFYNFSADQLKAFSERFKGKVCSQPFLSPIGRYLETGVLNNKCKDYLCPEDDFIREMFPTLVAGKLRAKALDPYGAMIPQFYGNRKNPNDTHASWKCIDEKCHAKLILRTVQPDDMGNAYGLFGCFSHQHEMPRQLKSQIVFKNKTECQEFYDQNLRMLYGKGQKMSETNTYFPCRRKCIGFIKKTKTFDPEKGYVNCTSSFSMCQTFLSKEFPTTPIEDRPYCLQGIFYHNHENDEKYHRAKGGFGTWKRYHDPPKYNKGTRRENYNYYIPKETRVELGLDTNITYQNRKVLYEALVNAGKITESPKKRQKNV